MKKNIILCADDYGISPGINQAILALVQQNKLSAISCMTLSEHLSEHDALALKAHHPKIAIGLHVTLTYLPPITGTFSAMSENQLFIKTWTRQIDRTIMEEEITAQFRRFIDLFGFPPDFIDGHQHVHVLPVIRDIVLQYRQKFAPKSWIRNVCHPCGNIIKKRYIVSILGWFFKQQLRWKKIPHNNSIYGFYNYADNSEFATRFNHWILHAKNNSLIYVHPGFPDSELTKVDSITTPRQREYDFFAEHDLNHINLVTYP